MRQGNLPAAQKVIRLFRNSLQQHNGIVFHTDMHSGVFGRYRSDFLGNKTPGLTDQCLGFHIGILRLAEDKEFRIGVADRLRIEALREEVAVTEKVAPEIMLRS